MGAKNDWIKVKASLSFVLYPRPPAVLGSSGNDYGITKWFVSEGIENADDLNCTEITVVGKFYKEVDRNEEYTLLLERTINEKYGEQYKVKSLFIDVDWSNPESQKAFLARIISPSQLTELYNTYPSPMEYIVNHDVEALTKVKGIGEYRAQKIIDKYESSKDLSVVYIAFDGYDFTENFISKVIDRYITPDLVIEKVLKHPYDLIWDVEGIGFKKADEIALKVGISPKSPERMEGFILYTLESKAQEGNSYIYAFELMDSLVETFGDTSNFLEVYKDEEGNVTGNNLTVALERLENANKIHKDETAENSQMRRIFLKKYFDLENKTAEHLLRLLNSPNKFEYSDWESKIKLQEEKQGWNFTQEQKDGIYLGLEKQVCFITGLGGTGKSSLVSGILSVLSNYSFAQCSLSGKAAARLQEVTGQEGYTIHRLLRYNPMEGFIKNGENQLTEYDIIIVDEISLIGGEIFLKLLEAIPSGTKLFILGDMGQLESIGCMNLAADLYYSDIIPMKELKQIHRQAQKSGIITSSHDVRKGEYLLPYGFEGKTIIGELQDMIIDIPDDIDVMDTILNYFDEYYRAYNEDIMKVQVISPIKERGNHCVAAINEEIQELVNPKREDEVTVVLSHDPIYDIDTEIRPRDKVLCIKNNYEVPSTEGRSEDIFNGWTGIVKTIKKNGDGSVMVTIYFPLTGIEVILNEKMVKENFMLGYAITCHKMQGASAPVVIGMIDYSVPPSMLTKELVYTMITRAEKKCIIVGNSNAIRKASENSGISDKKTFLQECLKIIYKKSIDK